MYICVYRYICLNIGVYIGVSHFMETITLAPRALGFRAVGLGLGAGVLSKPRLGLGFRV